MIQKIIFILAVVVWIAILSLLILVLTGKLEHYYISKYKFLTGIVFIAYSGIMRRYLKTATKFRLVK